MHDFNLGAKFNILQNKKHNGTKMMLYSATRMSELINQSAVEAGPKDTGALTERFRQRVNIDAQCERTMAFL